MGRCLTTSRDSRRSFVLFYDPTDSLLRNPSFAPVELSHGMGRIGSLPSASSLSDLLVKLEQGFQEHLAGKHIGPVRTSQDLNKTVQKVAIVTGSGSSVLSQLDTSVDVFITGDVSYHSVQAAVDAGLTIIDAGHWNTEAIFENVLTHRLQRLFPDLEVNRTSFVGDVFQ
ncbi:hypothetical protein GEMRC1_003004 [Eukaryota sp. GEM-RC1]